MEIRDYQRWLEAWDKARGWDRVSPSHTLIHALEELGEVARLILQWEGYKNAASPEQLRADLEEEIADVFIFLFKLAYQTGVDVEAALARGQAKADSRHSDLDQANIELLRYHARQQDLLAQMTKGQDTP
ncbi:MAG: MazG nucleotide pyrophosphohydrolase domain-containing protein [Anaerolineae bacterium]